MTTLDSAPAQTTTASPRAKRTLPARRMSLVLKPHGDEGDHVVKDPATGAYYHLGQVETFLLLQLDGKHTAEQITFAFAEKFGDPLSDDELDEFVELASSMRLLESTGETATAPAHADDPALQYRQSILYWRKSLFDPDRFFSWLEPKIRFVWTPAFLVASAAMILFAVSIVWADRQEIVTRFTDVLSWRTFVFAWLALVAATTLHEFAHGLMCKHYGGEVHEVGFLLLFFMPAFYCNVSDAWLFKEKSKRLWVTLAGGYCDFITWALSVFVWRMTIQDSLVNYIAWIIMSICGVRIFFNFNPLLKLDGYYLVSDIFSIPNLRQRSWDRLMEHVRWLLWGAPRPTREPKGRRLLGFGIAAWVYSFAFLALMFLGMIWWLGSTWGALGTIAAASLAVVVMKSQFHGVSQGQFMQMLRTRRTRLIGWTLAIALAAVVLVFVPTQQTASGTFQVRSTSRAEIRAPVAGFLREIKGDEGSRFAVGALVARLEVPDLDSRLAQKRAEIVESEAKLRVFRAGPRGDVSGAAAVNEVAIRSAEIDAEKARLAKLNEELRYLQEQVAKLLLNAPVAGVISTARLADKIGQYFKEGDLICVIEEPADLEAEIAVPEQDASRIRPGQEVRFKARAMPFDELIAKVDRVAPAAAAADPAKGQMQSTLAVYCKLANPENQLHPGMSGFARISCGKRAMGRVLCEKAYRFLRTEFWW